MIINDETVKKLEIRKNLSQDRKLELLIQRLEKQNMDDKVMINLISKVRQLYNSNKKIEVLLTLVRTEGLTARFRSDCVMLLAGMLESYGDEKAIKILLSLVKDEKLPEKMRCNCVGALTSILRKSYNKKVIDFMIPLVRNRNVSIDMRQKCVEGLAKVLGGRGDGEAIEVLLSLVRDERLAIVLRLVCVEELGHLAKEVPLAQTEALAALANLSLRSEVRAALALALGKSGNRTLAAPLRVCWEREQDERLKRTLLLALVCLDDLDLGVLAQVEELALQGHPDRLSSSESALWESHLPEYLVRHSGAETLGHLLRRSRFARGQLSPSLIEAIEAAERRDLVPVLLDVLEHSSMMAAPISLRGAKLRGLIQAISQLGETPEVARRLLALFQKAVIDSNLPVGYWVVDSLFEALWHVTRRAGLLVVERPRGSQRYVLLPRRGSSPADGLPNLS